MKSYDLVVASPLPGHLRLGVVLSREGIVEIDFLPSSAALVPPYDSKTHKVAGVLSDYFEARACQARLEIDLHGTPFQQKVWKALQAIPPGEVLTYGELARKIDSGPRAVAGACRANPIPILIPCHRVVAAKGLGGYMGATSGEELAIKRWLLTHERAC